LKQLSVREDLTRKLNLPFGNLVENEPNYSIDADEIRKRSSIVIEGCKQVGDNHFVKHWGEAA
jgi:peptide/nickel transport system ATP-binding protein